MRTLIDVLGITGFFLSTILWFGITVFNLAAPFESSDRAGPEPVAGEDFYVSAELHEHWAPDGTRCLALHSADRNGVPFGALDCDWR
jgi:hypothetical protein